VLPNASGNVVLFDRIYRVISSVDITHRYQNHALRENRDINLAVRQLQLAPFSCISNQDIEQTNGQPTKCLDLVPKVSTPFRLKTTAIKDSRIISKRFAQ